MIVPASSVNRARGLAGDAKRMMSNMVQADPHWLGPPAIEARWSCEGATPMAIDKHMLGVDLEGL